jgi:hypothetical protein
MNTVRFALTVAALPLTAGLLGSVDTAAQSRFAPPQQRQAEQQAMRFAEWDDNGDGVITRAEWQGTRAQFNAADTNKDGILSGTEVRLPSRRDQVRQPGEFNLDLDNNDDTNDAAGAVGTNGTVMTRRSQFMSLDDNGDGQLTFREWDGTRATFNRQDLDGDGVITRREYVGIEAGAAGPRAQARAANARVVTVDAQTQWTNTGLYVNAGDTIALDARGTARLSDDPNDIAEPAGARSGRRAAEAPMRDVLAGALIGRIGNSQPFGVGNQGTIRAPATGQLYLGVNDDHLPDNEGGFRVSISIR